MSQKKHEYTEIIGTYLRIFHDKAITSLSSIVWSCCFRRLRMTLTNSG